MKVPTLVINGSHFALFAFFCLLAVGVMLPSDGAHGLLSPKSLSFLFAALATVVCVGFHPVLKAANQRLLAFFAAAWLFLLVWTGLGVGNGMMALDQFKVFFITLSFTSIAAYLLHEEILSFPRFLNFVIKANFTYSLIKMTLATLHALHVFNLIKVMEKVGIRFMSMQILGDIGRLQTSVDILTPFILYFTLTSGAWGLNLSRGFKRIFIPLAWLSVALSFSRFLLFCALLAHAAFWFTENRKALCLSLLKFVLVLLCLIPLVGPERIIKVVSQRFFSDENSRSDEIRAHQIQALMATFEETPYLGKGIGGYAEKVIRDPKLKYSYEVQWVAFLMQFGLIGLSLLVLPLIFLSGKILSFPLSRVKISLFALFCLWLFAGLTNPFLISLSSGVIYALFYGASREQNAHTKIKFNSFLWYKEKHE